MKRQRGTLNNVNTTAAPANNPINNMKIMKNSSTSVPPPPPPLATVAAKAEDVSVIMGKKKAKKEATTVEVEEINNNSKEVVITPTGGEDNSNNSEENMMMMMAPWMQGCMVDEQMSWGSAWHPGWDMDFMGEDFTAAMYSDVVWDYDIWNLNNQIPIPHYMQ